MLNITLAQLKSDIAGMMKGTSIREVKDFYGTAAAAANRMIARVDTEETRVTQTLSTPFYDNVNDYVCPADYNKMIDIRPQANRTSQPGDSDYQQTTAKQFNERLAPDSYSIRWNKMVRTIRAQRLPSGNVVTVDTFESATSNGLWTGEADASGLYTESVNYIQGNSALGFNLSGVTGAGDIVNSTAVPLDLTAYNNEDASMLFVYIPIGYSSRITSFGLRRGSSATAYLEQIVTQRADGTAFTDGWNFLLFQWNQATQVGTPDNTQNTYRRFNTIYTAGSAINGMLLDSWTDALGDLYEVEYYSQYLFRTAAGIWIPVPLEDTDLVNVGPNTYEILKTEMMISITQQVRTGAVRVNELTDWRLMLNGQPQSRYIKDPPYHGLYADYQESFPSSAITTSTSTYEFDV